MIKCELCRAPAWLRVAKEKERERERERLEQEKEREREREKDDLLIPCIALSQQASLVLPLHQSCVIVPAACWLDMMRSEIDFLPAIPNFLLSSVPKLGIQA